MTAIILNQQIGTMEKKALNFKKVFFYSLPFLASSYAYSVGYDFLVIPVFVAMFILGVVFQLAIIGKDTEDETGEKAFIQSLENEKVFEMTEAKKLLKRYNAVIYRVDSRNHKIQFFINEKKYTMFIKPKA